MHRRLLASVRARLRLARLSHRAGPEVQRDRHGAVQHLRVAPNPNPPPSVHTHVAALVSASTTTADCLSIDHNLHGGRGRIVRHSVLNEHSRQASTLQLWTVAVGASEGMHVHGSAGMEPQSERLGALEELYVCLQGRGTIDVQRADHAVENVAFAPGDTVLVPPGVWHGVTNTGDTPLQFLILWGPPAPPDAVIVRE